MCSAAWIRREPDAHPWRVRDVSVQGDPELAEFYALAYPRLVGVLSAMADGVADAEGCVQDAFVKLIPRWDRIRRYDDPEAWVRQVAVRHLLSRHRHRQVATRALARLVDRNPSPPPNGDRVDVESTMRSLPTAHRAVLVLHHGLGMSVEEVAEALGVPAGTVKSRLSRARAAFGTSYTTEVATHG